MTLLMQFQIEKSHNTYKRIKNMENNRPQTYTEAIAEVEKILARFGDGTLDVDTLAAEVKRATELIRTCKERLTRAEKEVAAVLNSDTND
jgi:exodeoxyribonuclease VII small subunit